MYLRAVLCNNKWYLVDESCSICLGCPCECKDLKKKINIPHAVYFDHIDVLK